MPTLQLNAEVKADEHDEVHDQSCSGLPLKLRMYFESRHSDDGSRRTTGYPAAANVRSASAKYNRWSA